VLKQYLKITAKAQTANSNFVEKIRICLSFCLSLDYVINQIKPKAQRAGPIQTSFHDVLKPTLF
jgi:hypothetical protein